LPGSYYPFKTWLDEGHVWEKDSLLIRGDDHEAHQAEPTPGGTNTRQNQHRAEQHLHSYTAPGQEGPRSTPLTNQL